MALGTLSIDLEARLTKLEQGMEKAGRLSAKTAAGIEREFGLLKSVGAELSASLAGAFAVAGVTQFVRSTIDGLDSMNDLKDVTGSTIENISALDDIAARTGTSYEVMADTLVKFNKILSDAEPGTKQANMLKQIGLNAEELRQIDPAEALRLTAVQLAKFADDADKARLVQELFGKSVKEAGPYLKDLAEAGQLHATATAKQAEEAEKFNKQIANLSRNFTDLSRTIVGDLLPAWNNLFDRSKTEGFFGAWMNDLQRGRAASMAAELGRVTEEYSKFVAMRASLQAKGQDLNPFQLLKLKELREEMDALTKKSGDLNSAVKRALGQPVADGLPVASYSNEGRNYPAQGSVGNAARADGPKKTSDFERLLQQLEDEQIALIDLSREEQVLWAIQSGRVKDVTDAERELLIQRARGIDLTKKQADADAQRIDFSAIDELIARQKDLNALLERTPTAVIEKQRTLQIDLAAAYEEGRFGIIGSEEAMRGYTEAVQTALPELQGFKDETNSFAQQAANNIQSAFGETIKMSLKGDFDDILDLWANMLIDMAAQAAAANLAKSMFGADFGKTGEVSGDSWAGSALSFFGGVFGGGRASGGPVAPGGVYDINERGDPEVLNLPHKQLLLMGKQGGYITPLFGKGGGGAGAQATEVHHHKTEYNIAGGVSRSEVMALMQQLELSNRAYVQQALRSYRG